jgi:putative endonuclease
MPPIPDEFPSIPCPDPVPGLAWVYLLRSADGSYYIGRTGDLRERLRKHHYGLGSQHTHDHAQPKLVFYEGPMALEAAVKREAQLKGWTRAEKEALILGDRSQLQQLSKSRD